LSTVSEDILSLEPSRAIAVLASCVATGMSQQVCRNRYIVKEPLSGEPEERQRFMKCNDCGRWIDMRSVADVIAHEETCGGALGPPVPQT
jgi:hypothetical protein